MNDRIHGRPMPEGYTPDFTCPVCGSHDFTYEPRGALVCLGVEKLDASGNPTKDADGKPVREPCTYRRAPQRRLTRGAPPRSAAAPAAAAPATAEAPTKPEHSP